jgi:Flp pilus assembly protein TadB
MAPTNSWYLERIIFLIAGFFVLISLVLGLLLNPYWFILAFLVGINLIIFALTGFCIMANILYKFGVRPKIK